VNPEINSACGKLLQRYLMASYAYYILNMSLMGDDEYDQIAKLLFKYYDEFEHQHKYLVTKDDLSATTLYALRTNDYPLMVRGGVEHWLKVLATTE